MDVKKMSSWLFVSLSSNEMMDEARTELLKVGNGVWGYLPNQTLATPFTIVRKVLHIISSGVIYKSIKVLNDSM